MTLHLVPPDFIRPLIGHLIIHLSAFITWLIRGTMKSGGTKILFSLIDSKLFLQSVCILRSSIPQRIVSLYRQSAVAWIDLPPHGILARTVGTGMAPPVGCYLLPPTCCTCLRVEMKSGLVYQGKHSSEGWQEKGNDQHNNITFIPLKEWETELDAWRSGRLISRQKRHATD